jgi:hypothetical protein
MSNRYIKFPIGDDTEQIFKYIRENIFIGMSDLEILKLSFALLWKEQDVKKGTLKSDKEKNEKICSVNPTQLAQEELKS